MGKKDSHSDKFISQMVGIHVSFLSPSFLLLFPVCVSSSVKRRQLR